MATSENRLQEGPDPQDKSCLNDSASREADLSEVCSWILSLHSMPALLERQRDLHKRVHHSPVIMARTC
jgi:hypothetical protein